jgi:uncharacterized membrane protein
MSRYDWLLFLHVLAAFALVAGLVLLTAALLLASRSAGDAPLALALTRFSPILFDAAGVAILVFGVWLVFEADWAEFGDVWVIASLVLWAVVAFAGARALAAFRRTRRNLEPGTDLAAAVRAGRAPIYNTVAVVATFVTLVLMIFKPGA